VAGRWVDLREAAELLSTSTEAVRKRASIRSEHHDGRVVVWVDDDRTMGGREAQGEASADGVALVEVLTEQVAYLKAQLDIRTEELREHRRLLAGLIERVPELEAPAETSTSSQPSEEPAQDGANGVGVAPSADGVGPKNGSGRVSWWRRVFGG